jgi:hypothetical protein
MLIPMMTTITEIMMLIGRILDIKKQRGDELIYSAKLGVVGFFLACANTELTL